MVTTPVTSSDIQRYISEKVGALVGKIVDLPEKIMYEKSDNFLEQYFYATIKHF